jgi:hypothetical protein
MITAERVDRIEVRLILAADDTLPVFVQGVGVYKRRPADDTEMIRLQRLGKGKARRADGYSRNWALQRLLADAAVVGENKVKERRGKALNYSEPLDRR